MKIKLVEVKKSFHIFEAYCPNCGNKMNSVLVETVKDTKYNFSLANAFNSGFALSDELLDKFVEQSKITPFFCGECILSFRVEI